MKLLKNRKHVASRLGLMVSTSMFILGFQSCSPTRLKIDSKTTLANSIATDVAAEGATRGITAIVAAPVVAAPRVTAPVVTAPVVTAPVVTAPVVTAPVEQASGEDCQSELAIAEWDSSAKFTDIKLDETSFLGSSLGQQTMLSSSGFKLSFKGVKTSVNNSPKISPDIPAGFEIKFTNVNTNNSFNISPSDYTAAYDSAHFVSENGVLSNTTSLHTTKYNRVAFNQIVTAGGTVIPGRTNFDFIITRDVYDRNQGLGNTKVELFCKGSLVASKVVNFLSDENSVIFKSYFERTDFTAMYGFTTSTGKKVSYFEKRFDGYIQPFCPATAKPGEKVTCTVQKSKIASFKWTNLPDRVGHDSSLDNNVEVSFIAPAAGARYVGIKGVTNDGKIVYGSLYITVK